MKLVVASVLLMAAASPADPAPQTFDQPSLLSGSQICQTMMPDHGDAKPSTDPLPYNIRVEPTSVKGGDVVTVHITGDEGFKAYYIQARLGDEPVGEFLFPTWQSNAIFLSDCPPGYSNAYSIISYNNPFHASDTDWKAPNINGEIVFRVTFVKDYRHFWVGVPSEPVTITKVNSTDNAAAA